MSNNYSHFTVESKGAVTVVTLSNPEYMDRLIVNELQDDLVKFVESDKPRFLLVSFTNVKFCSSETINALLRSRLRVVKYGGHMKLCGMNQELRNVYKILRLDGTVFEIFDSCNDAWSSF